MKKLVNENIEKLVPYKVPKHDYKVKLDANENPYSIPEMLDEGLKEELKESIFTTLWNYYPDSEAYDLRKALAEKNGVKEENIIMGNGSDEIILNLVLTYLNSEKSLVIHPPTFSVYKIFAQVVNAKIIEVPLDNSFELDKDKMIEAVKRDDAALTFITYPNNPTGNLFKEEVILEILENAKGIVVIDEAYFEFAKKSFIDKLPKYKNMVILRTFSKAYGIAGVRVGYLIADTEITDELNKVRLPYNLNKISQIIALKMLKNEKRFNDMIEEILAERGRMYKELENVNGITLYKSDTNAVFFKCDKAEEIFSELLKNKILVRKFSGNMEQFLRISIGKQEDNDTVLKIIKKIV